MNYNLKLLRKPVPFQPGTLTLWSNEYIRKNVLEIHLDGNIDSGSRRSIIIEKTVEGTVRTPCVRNKFVVYPLLQLLVENYEKFE